MCILVKDLRVISLLGMCYCHIISRFAKMPDFYKPIKGHWWCDSVRPSMSFVCTSLWPLMVWLSPSIHVHLSVRLSVHPSISPSIHPSVHQSVYLYICLYIHLALYFCLYVCLFIQIVSAWKLRRNCRILFRFVRFPKGSSILQYFNGLFCCNWIYVYSNKILKILHFGFTGDLLMLYFF